MTPQTIEDVRTKEIQGTEVPALGLGTWMLEGRECREAVRDALEIGYRHLDTAQAYGNEEEVGRGLADSGVPRDEVWLTTKLWLENLDHDKAIESARGSLRRLGTDYVDLLLIHWPPTSDLPIAEPLRAMRRLQGDGLVRHIGVSNFPPSLLDQALDEAEIFCEQVEYHPFLAQDPLLQACEEWDLLLTAYSPLARGEVLEDETLREIGRRHGKGPAQVTLRWLLQQEQVAAVPKAASAEHRRSNFEVFDFELSLDEMEAIHGLARGERIVDPEFAPRWENP
jgi:2,5-diketo-D-gluconate reductase B